MGAEGPGGRGGLRTDTQHHVRGCRRPWPGGQVGPAQGACGMTHLLRARASPRAFCSRAFFSSSSSSLRLTARSSCWASHLMSLATTTAVCRSAWKRRHSSVSSWKSRSPRPLQTGPQAGAAGGPRVGPRARLAVAASPPGKGAGGAAASGKGAGGAAASGVGVPVLKSRPPELPSRPHRSWFQDPGPRKPAIHSGPGSRQGTSQRRPHLCSRGPLQ